MNPISKPIKKRLHRLLTTMLLVYSNFLLAQPVANFSSNIEGGCSPIVVDFTDLSSGNPTGWKWDLGNGTFSNLQNPSVSYFTPGVYTIKLYVRAGNSSDSLVKTNYITVYQPPSVNFIADAVTGCSPFTVIFSDLSNANGDLISSWQWDFGDGILSAQQHPSHTYSLAGNYSVTLKVINSKGCLSTVRKGAYIKVNSITAGFSSMISGTCTPNKIVFQSTTVSSGTFTGQWDFGDGTVSTQTNPTHTYTAAGNYTVKLVQLSQQGCADSVIHMVNILLPVSASFLGNNLVSCRPPVTVNFNNQQLPGNRYFWNFGDSTTSILSNPAHIFSDTGIYKVKLVVRNTNGCVDSLQKDRYVIIQKPFLALQSLPDSGCLAFTKLLSVNVNSVSPITNYAWDFGDGATSSLAAPVHTFSNAGYYNIKVVGTAATGCTDTAYIPYGIKVTTKPVAGFSADTRNSCANSPISFTNLSSGTVSTWLWNFGDYGVSTNKDPSHLYTDTEWMNVQLIAMNGGCADTAFLSSYIYIKPAVAKFNIIMNCATPLVRTFKNLSKGSNRWLWDFGDGSSSTDFEPVHTFPGQGTFSVTLNAYNDSTGCRYSKIKPVRILDITTTFFAADTLVCKKTDVNFISGVSNYGITRYFWTFGDNSTFNSSYNNTLHAYQNTGTYSVKLVTKDSLNCMDTVIKSMYIKVAGPKARFGVSVPVACANTAVDFLDSSAAGISGPISRWIWNYADGGIDTLSAPPFQHLFFTQGNYLVTLKIIDSSGCSDQFRLPAPLPITKVNARFTILDTVACPNLPVRFSCPYATPAISYNWDFGDGAVSALQSPAHAYANEGIYTVKLFLRDRNGCTDTYTILNAVRIAQTIASFTISDSFKSCPPLIIQFTNHSTNAVGEYWDFGDSSFTDAHNPSHFYTYPGVYTATLYAKGPGGCVKTMQRPIVVHGPKGILSYNPLKLCKPYNVTFHISSADAVSYIWDFNDGATLANTDSIITHPYQDSGKFVPKIILVDNAGCRVPVSGRDTINNLFANVGFTFPDVVICDRNNQTFTNTTISNDQLASYHWDFGDSAVSTQKSPIHQYALPGLYYPSLSVITLNGCGATYRSPIPVKVALSPNISMMPGGNGCIPLTTTLSAVQMSADTSSINWYWVFGNGVTSTLQNPAQQLYAAAGTYSVSLTASSSNGCSKTIGDIIEAYPLPLMQVSGDTFLCRGKVGTLKASGAASYNWLPAAGLSCNTCATTLTTTTESTLYKVTGTSLKGCNSRDSFTINVQQPFVMTWSQPDKLCTGQSKRLQANGASTYQWSPVNGLNNATSSSPVAQPDTTTNYRVIGTDNLGCFKDTGFVKLTVYPIPNVSAGADKKISLGIPVYLQAVFSNDVTQVHWSPTDGAFRNSQDAITVKPSLNTEYTVEVKNIGGCSAKDKVTVFVTCDNDNVFVPTLFSPNADGVNDVFYPRGRGLFKIKSLVIFNRWGEAIFEKRSFNANDASAGWDGTFKGSKLTPDVYVYILELICDNNSVLSLNGNIALVK